MSILIQEKALQFVWYRFSETEFPKRPDEAVCKVACLFKASKVCHVVVEDIVFDSRLTFSILQVYGIFWLYLFSGYDVS